MFMSSAHGPSRIARTGSPRAGQGRGTGCEARNDLIFQDVRNRRLANVHFADLLIRSSRALARRLRRARRKLLFRLEQLLFSDQAARGAGIGRPLVREIDDIVFFLESRTGDLRMLPSPSFADTGPEPLRWRG